MLFLGLKPLCPTQEPIAAGKKPDLSRCHSKVAVLGGVKFLATHSSSDLTGLERDSAAIRQLHCPHSSLKHLVTVELITVTTVVHCQSSLSFSLQTQGDCLCGGLSWDKSNPIRSKVTCQAFLPNQSDRSRSFSECFPSIPHCFHPTTLSTFRFLFSPLPCRSYRNHHIVPSNQHQQAENQPCCRSSLFSLSFAHPRHSPPQLQLHLLFHLLKAIRSRRSLFHPVLHLTRILIPIRDLSQIQIQFVRLMRRRGI